MANIPGATNVLPGVFTDVVTESRGTATAGGLRVPAIMGEGSTSEVIVSSAIGNGKDGLDGYYKSANGADGRHFLLSLYPVISNRTKLYRNGVLLSGIEQSISTTPFSNKYDYRLDITNGRIELQKAYLVDQGGDDYLPFGTNKGDGYITNLELLDQNAPRETWSIRCLSVSRDNNNDPIPGTARFVAVGSVSGNKLDSNNKSVEWVSDGYTASNGILSFRIWQGTGVALSEGDGFTIKVNSGRLSRNDSLTATYIPELYINDPVQLQGMDQVVKRHGSPSVDNNLSLGCQLAFANSTSSVVTVQCAPPVPRRTSITLSESVNSVSVLDDDFVFPLPLGFTPDPDSNIHFFIIDNATGVETQVLPNKKEFYTVGTGGANPTVHQFITESQYSFYYSVIKNYKGDATVMSGTDGYIVRDPQHSNGNYGIFSSVSETFTSDLLGKQLKITNATNVANNAEYLINAVAGNKLYLKVDVNSYDPFSAEAADTTSLGYEVIDPATGLPTGHSDTDGEILNIVNVSTAHFNSAGLPFTPADVGMRLQINSGLNSGLFDITAYDGNTDTVTIKKSVVIESNLTWAVQDPDMDSYYVVIHNDVVPNTFGLRVNVVDIKDSKFYDAGWLYALASLEKTNVDIVVPLPKSTISVIFQNALSHCLTMSNIRNKKERVLFIGAISGLAPENLIGSAADGTNVAVAVEDIGILEGIQGDSITEQLNGNTEDLANYSVSDAFGKVYRCVYFNPDQIVVQAGTENVYVDGFYIAAAAAGWCGSQPRVEMPLTNKVLGGFSILRDKRYSQLTLESLASSGVCTLQPVAGGGQVVWGITTTQSGFAEEQEISIVFIRDRIAKVLRASFAGYIGLPETQTTQVTLANQAINVLNSFINQGMITAYKDLAVQRDSVDPRQWNIYVKVQPTYPVNWIYIRVGVGTI